MQTPLVDSAAVAAAWHTFPESAPFHGLSVHVVSSPPSAAQRAVVISALAERLGATLCVARACDVCVVCTSTSTAAGPVRKKQRTGVNTASATVQKPRCKAGAVVVKDAWVVEAVQSASRLDYDGFLL